MVSEMAMEDLAQLRADGSTVGDREVVRVNALGLLVERGPYSGVVFAAPRVAFAGTMPIYEPTIQSERWYLAQACEWWCGASAFWALAWACANAPVKGWFDRWTSEGPTRTVIEWWVSQLPCTFAQLRTAVEYAVHGEAGPGTAPQSTQEREEPIVGCPYTDLINNALACNLGLTPERIAVMPRRRVVDIMRKWTANQIAMAGGSADLDKGSKTDAYVKYDDYLISLRDPRKDYQLYG